jgi:hypothetical protein
MVLRSRKWRVCCRGLGLAKVVLEVADGVEEGRFLDGDDEVDGVEVFLTAEAPREVGSGIGGGVELVAEGAEEAEEPIAGFGGDVEMAEDVPDGDTVSQAVEFGGVDAWHGVFLSSPGSGAWLGGPFGGRGGLEDVQVELFVDLRDIVFVGGHEEFTRHGHENTEVAGGMLDQGFPRGLGEQVHVARLLECVGENLFEFLARGIVQHQPGADPGAERHEVRFAKAILESAIAGQDDGEVRFDVKKRRSPGCGARSARPEPFPALRPPAARVAGDWLRHGLSIEPGAP